MSRWTKRNLEQRPGSMRGGAVVRKINWVYSIWRLFLVQSFHVNFTIFCMIKVHRLCKHLRCTSQHEFCCWWEKLWSLRFRWNPKFLFQLAFWHHASWFWWPAGSTAHMTAQVIICLFVFFFPLLCRHADCKTAMSACDDSKASNTITANKAGQAHRQRIWDVLCWFDHLDLTSLCFIQVRAS